MKKLILFFSLLIIGFNGLHAQSNVPEGVNVNQLPIVYLSSSSSVHFISPELIQYVDIPFKRFIGDLPMKNIVRIKAISDTSKIRTVQNDGVLTIVGERYIAQYHIVLTDNDDPRVKTEIEILPENTKPLDVSGVGLSQGELKLYSLSLLSQKCRGHLAQSKAYGIKARLNHIYTLDEFIFFDISYFNSTNLKYDVDQIRFKIEDRKVTKATNVQSVEILPAFTLFDIQSFKKETRNIYVFKKFSFPGNKLLKTELSEKQISGRVSTLAIKYKDVLNADVVPMN